MNYKTMGVALLMVAVVISAFLEWVKLLAKKRHKEIPTWVQIAIPAALSVVLSWVVWSALSLPGEVQIIALYSLIVFLGQYYLSMEILKRIGRPIAKFFMRSKGMTDQEIQEALGG
ncbi:MAG: hypothetical protein VB025_07585 [Sphaerochaeta sp.]|nr:hypothetical protein [Sphaerochaeta sp.]